MKAEQEILNKSGKRAIRLDAWAKDRRRKIFGFRILAGYTFSGQCEEMKGLYLGDGTTKIFLNMANENGSQELVSLLQYMKDTRLENPQIIVKDERILELDRIVKEVDLRRSLKDDGFRKKLYEEYHI